jgi:hypothetical protein
MSEPAQLSYQGPPRTSGKAFVLFIASIAACCTFFLVVPPVVTLLASFVIRGRLCADGDDLGMRRAAAAFATSVIGTLLALLFGMAALLNGRVI